MWHLLFCNHQEAIAEDGNTYPTLSSSVRALRGLAELENDKAIIKISHHGHCSYNKFEGLEICQHLQNNLSEYSQCTSQPATLSYYS